LYDRSNDEVRIYEVSTISTNGPLYTQLSSNQHARNNGILSLLFLSLNKVVTGGNEGTLTLWTYTSPSRSKSQSRVIWTMNPWNCKYGQCGGITEVVPLSPKSDQSNTKCSFLLIATSIGYFAVVDVNQFSTKSFSSKATPKVLKTWSLCHLGGVKNHVLPRDTWMGVQKIYVWAEKPKSFDESTGINASSSSCQTTLVDVAVITTGGWIISLKFDIKKNAPFETPRARVLHRSPYIKQYNSTRTRFDQDPNGRASVPYFPSVYGKLDQAASWLVVTKTHPIYEVLPESDKRVLSQSIGTDGLICSANMNEEPDGLSVVHRNWGNQFTIPIQGKLKHISIHPDNEWIVAYLVAPGGKLSIKLMSCRNTSDRKRLKSTMNKENLCRRSL